MQRSVRDRYRLLEKKAKAKRNDENKASGISPETSEVFTAMDNLIERFEEADNIRTTEATEKKSKTETELLKAQELRKESLETLGETKKRKGESDCQPKKTLI